MTLNCDLPIEQAQEEFRESPSDETAAFYLESALEYWRCDQVTDNALADMLSEVLPYLRRAR